MLLFQRWLPGNRPIVTANLSIDPNNEVICTDVNIPFRDNSRMQNPFLLKWCIPEGIRERIECLLSCNGCIRPIQM